MELVDSNEVVEKKKQESFFIPIEVRDTIKTIAARWGSKRKWAVYTAALLVFLEIPEEERDRLISRVLATEAPGFSFADLVKEAEDIAKSGVSFKMRRAAKSKSD
jgi:hypothetical protein